LFAGLLVAAAFATQANAQATRTWVSGVGDDANPCSRTAPCKTFAGAISKTAGGGEINVLDPGGFGGVTITKSIKIIADHVEAGVLVSGTNAIIVAAGVNDRVWLEGLDIEGLGTGINGVLVSGGVKELYVVRCTIKNFTNTGVAMLSTTANSRVNILDSNIVFNATGVNIQGNGVAATGLVTRTMIDSNTVFGIQASGASNVVNVANSVITNSPTALNVVNSATAVSFGPSNVIIGGGAFTSTPAFK
jgi:hypothetical protein